MAILRVPVVGRDDRHDVDVLAIEDLAVVFVDVDLAVVAVLRVLPFGDLACLRAAWLASTSQTATQSANFIALRADRLPAVAGADAAEDRAFVRAVEAERAGRIRW